MSDTVIAAVLGLVAGAAGSLVAPLVNWRIDERRQRQARRAALIESWRVGLAATPVEDWHEGMATAWYESLRPHLSENTTTSLERPRTYIVPPDGPRNSILVLYLADEIARIEREWHLV